MKVNNETDKEKIILHKDDSLRRLNTLFDNYINNEQDISKADKLAYWIKDYCDLLRAENTFNPQFLKSYKRGDVIQVNLGYNIGNEEGGLHYCIVLDRNNSIKSGIITVIPLTSDKGQKLDFSEISLGNEIYAKFKTKYNNYMKDFTEKIKTFSKNQNENDIQETLKELSTIKKMEAKMAKMKKGSIALVSQITTVSKQRIYDPQKTTDLLTSINISDDKLDLINQKLKQLFIKL